MRGRRRESERVETPPHGANIFVVPAKVAISVFDALWRPQSRDPYAAADGEGAAYGSPLSRGRPWDRLSDKRLVRCEYDSRKRGEEGLGARQLPLTRLRKSVH
jgi:hypothetical protein